MQDKKLVAIVGMCGAGKSVVTEEFHKKGYEVIHFGDATQEYIRNQGQEVTEANEKRVREELRAQYGMAAYAQLNLEKIRASLRSSDVVIDGLYSWEEYKVLSKEFPELVLLAVVADRKLRYLRLATREVRSLVNIEAELRDIAEIENIEKGGPIAYADVFIVNNGTMSDLQKAVNEFLVKINSN